MEESVQISKSSMLVRVDRKDFFGEERIYGEFSRAIAERKGKGQLDEWAVQTKVLELGGADLF